MEGQQVRGRRMVAGQQRQPTPKQPLGDQGLWGLGLGEVGSGRATASDYQGIDIWDMAIVVSKSAPVLHVYILCNSVHDDAKLDSICS